METHLPGHIAIIPDGNRRWAKEKNLKPWEGHIAGAENTELLIRKARELGIREISFWGSSLDNLVKRPLEEKKALLDLYQKHFSELLESEELKKGEVRVRIIGRWKELFPASLKRTLEVLEENTKNCGPYRLNFLLAYSGDDDMLQAIEAMTHAGLKKVTGEVLKEHLMSRELSPVDYMIRTGGEPHLSAGFLMWESANAELYFSELMYPDFGPRELEIALEDYARRGRRKGQ